MTGISGVRSHRSGAAHADAILVKNIGTSITRRETNLTILTIIICYSPYSFESGNELQLAPSYRVVITNKSVGILVSG